MGGCYSGFADLEFGLEKSRNSDLKCLSRYHLFALFLRHYKKETIGKAWISLCLVIRETRFPSWLAAEATPSQFLELSYQVSITYLQTDEFWLRKEVWVRWRFHLNFRLKDFITRHLLNRYRLSKSCQYCSKRGVVLIKVHYTYQPCII